MEENPSFKLHANYSGCRTKTVKKFVGLYHVVVQNNQYVYG